MESTKTLVFSKEGVTEKKQAVLMAGDGYAVYLPEDEWEQAGSDRWTAAVNKKVCLWIKHYKGSSIKKISKKLAGNGYAASKNASDESGAVETPIAYEMIKQKGDTISKARLIKYDREVWGVFYCCPADAEEGFGRELPLIADTFRILIEK